MQLKKEDYIKFELQPYLRSRENISNTTQRQIFALRIQMNQIKANFCSRNKIPICDQCENKIDNYHLLECSAPLRGASFYLLRRARALLAQKWLCRMDGRTDRRTDGRTMGLRELDPNA